MCAFRAADVEQYHAYRTERSSLKTSLSQMGVKRQRRDDETVYFKQTSEILGDTMTALNQRIGWTSRLMERLEVVANLVDE